jgi:hypothetical protein
MVNSKSERTTLYYVIHGKTTHYMDPLIDMSMYRLMMSLCSDAAQPNAECNVSELFDVCFCCV